MGHGSSFFVVNNWLAVFSRPAALASQERQMAAYPLFTAIHGGGAPEGVYRFSSIDAILDFHESRVSCGTYFSTAVRYCVPSFLVISAENQRRRY